MPTQFAKQTARMRQRSLRRGGREGHRANGLSQPAKPQLSCPPSPTPHGPPCYQRLVSTDHTKSPCHVSRQAMSPPDDRPRPASSCCVPQDDGLVGGAGCEAARTGTARRERHGVDAPGVAGKALDESSSVRVPDPYRHVAGPRRDVCACRRDEKATEATRPSWPASSSRLSSPMLTSQMRTRWSCAPDAR